MFPSMFGLDVVFLGQSFQIYAGIVACDLRRNYLIRYGRMQALRLSADETIGCWACYPKRSCP